MKIKKSKTDAFILAVTMGLLGAHHFYLNNIKRGVLYLFLSLSGYFLLFIPNMIVAILVIIELFNIHRMTDEYNEQLFKELFPEN